MDLFQHIMRKAVFHGSIRIPGGLHVVRSLTVTAYVEDRHLVGGQADDFSFGNNKILFRIGKKCGKIRGDHGA